MRILFNFLCVLLFFGCQNNSQTKLSDQTESQNHIEFKLISDLECFDTESSKQFDLKIRFLKYENDSASVKITVFGKNSDSPKDSLILASDTIWQGVFEDCKNIKSYSGQSFLNNEISDNYFGDLVISDFNFDGMDDLAVFRNHGNSSGPFYDFLIQQDDLKFISDQFLKDSVRIFPSEINSADRMIKTFEHSGICGLTENSYQLDDSGKWKLKNQKEINICDE